MSTNIQTPKYKIYKVRAGLNLVSCSEPHHLQVPAILIPHQNPTSGVPKTRGEDCPCSNNIISII